MQNTIDQEKINVLQELMGDAFGMLIETFITDTSNTITLLRTELSAQNSGEIHRLAHSLKSSSANLGADGLSDLAKQLESDAKDANLSHAEGYIDKIDSIYKDVSAALKLLT